MNPDVLSTILEKLGSIRSYDTKLETQIQFYEAINTMFRTPLSDSILSSLKELRGIKQSQLTKLKEKSK